MSVKITHIWDDEIPGVLWINMEGTRPTWTDYHTSFEEGIRLISTLEGRGDLILYLNVTTYPHGSPFPHYEAVGRKMLSCPNFGMQVTVTPLEALVKTLVGVTLKVTGTHSARFPIVRTKEQGRSLVLAARAAGKYLPRIERERQAQSDAAQPAADVTAQPAADVTAQPAADVTAQPAADVTAQPAADVTAQPAPETAAPADQQADAAPPTGELSPTENNG